MGKPKDEKPVDLTEKPKLKQKIDDIKPTKVVKKRKVRRVYGLKKVYSSGLGSGGAASNAVVGKFGNTTNKNIDTVTASQEEIKGEVVSITTISIAPKVKRRVTPEYTKEMTKNNVTGQIKMKVLVKKIEKKKEKKKEIP